MRILKKIAIRFLVAVINQMPVSALNFFEGRVQQKLGKGWGSDSVSAEAQVISSFVRSKGIQRVFALDVGANFGNWTAALLAEIPDAQIAAFEPSGEAFVALESRFINHPNVRSFNLALGKYDGQATLFSDKSASGLASLTKRRLEHFDLEFNCQENVAIRTLDSWWEKQKNETNFFQSPNVLKMDVEGHELDVLTGAINSLSEIQIVQFEFGGSNIDTRTFFQDFWYLFTDLSFEIFRLSPKGIIPIISYSELDESFRTTNYFAVRR
jgi:FkbM family methyltransferase